MATSASRKKTEMSLSVCAGPLLQQYGGGVERQGALVGKDIGWQRYGGRRLEVIAPSPPRVAS